MTTVSSTTLTYVPTRTQQSFMLSPAYIRVLAGPIGGGKSVTCVHELIRWSTEQAPDRNNVRRTRFLVVRNTADQLKSTTFKTIFDWIPQGEVGTWVGTDKTYYIRFGLPDGTIVETDWLAIALDTPDDVRKALSLEATGMWGNESRELHPDVVDGLLMRVNRYPSMKDGGPTRPGAIFDTNYPEIGSWWFEKMTTPPGNWSTHDQPPAVLTLKEWQTKYGVGSRRWVVGQTEVRASSTESGKVEVWAEKKGQPPVNLIRTGSDLETYIVDHESDNFANLNPSYYPETLEGKSAEFINVYLRCQFGQSKEGQPVYPPFRRNFHVAKNSLVPIEDANRPLLIGMDFGLTPACTISQLDPRGRLLTFAELASENMGLRRFLTEKLKPLLAHRFRGLPVIVIGDPSGRIRSQKDESSLFDELRQQGFQAQPAPTNSLAPRIEALEMWLVRAIDGGPAHLIDPSCERLIAALSGAYRYRMKKSGETEATPEKNDASHLVEGHQYTCLFVETGMAPGGRLESSRGKRREVHRVSMRAWV